MTRIAQHLAFIIVACLAGGYLIEFVLTGQHREIRRLTEEYNATQLLVKDLERLESDFSQYLISADLILGSDESYLLSGALKKGEMIHDMLVTIRERGSVDIEMQRLSALTEGFDQTNQVLLQSQTLTEDARDSQLSALLRRYDRVSQYLVFNLEEIRRQAIRVQEAQSLVVERKLSENKLATFTLRVFYGLVVFLLWWWSNAYISRPIRRLSEAAKQLAQSDDLTLDIGGPKEIVELGYRFEAMATELLYQARHDPLTGLYNRREFARRLAERFQSLENSVHHERILCFIDLDRFKNVNDSCGHAAGDELLVLVAKNIKLHAGDNSIVARLGGDEFAILLEENDKQQGIRIATEILHAIRAIRFKWEDSIYRISASIGVTLISDRGASITDWLNAADSACFAAKELGRDKIQIFEIDDDRLVSRKSETKLYNRIIQALENDRLVLYRQDIIPLQATHKGDYFEVLVRMLGEDGRIIAPGEFLGIAERYQLAEKLDRWVVDATLAFFEDHPSENATLNTVSINLSGQSLASKQMREYLVSRIMRSSLPAEKICFEITETAVINDLLEAKAMIRCMRELGCRFALDDFGSGLSSFGYLQQLEVDLIKIDGAFIREIQADPLNEIMVRCINEITQAANMKTVAEYVENIEIVEKLRAMGVDYAQGYHFCKPRAMGAKMRISPLKSACS